MAYKCCVKAIDTNDEKHGNAIAFVNVYGDAKVLQRSGQAGGIDYLNSKYGDRVAANELYYSQENADQP